MQKIRVRSCRCSSFFAKGHAHAGYSLASALMTPLVRYQPCASVPQVQIFFGDRLFRVIASFISLAPIFYAKNRSSLMPLLLLIRKRSRSRRLLACKRAHDAFGSLPTFCERAAGTNIFCKNQNSVAFAAEF